MAIAPYIYDSERPRFPPIMLRRVRDLHCLHDPPEGSAKRALLLRFRGVASASNLVRRWLVPAGVHADLKLAKVL